MILLIIEGSLTLLLGLIYIQHDLNFIDYLVNSSISEIFFLKHQKMPT